MSKITGYIEKYTIQNAIITPESTGNISGLTDYTNVVYYGITNTYNLKSPNNKDQMIILTSDNKYIVYVSYKDPYYITPEAIQKNILTKIVQEYQMINVCISMNKVILKSDMSSLAEKVNPLMREKESRPDYAKNDPVFTTTMQNIPDNTDDQTMLKRMNAIIELVNRKNPENLDIKLLTAYTKLGSITTLPDTYCFQLDNILPLDPIAQYSCTVRTNASSSLSSQGSSGSTGSSGSSGLSIGAIIGIIVGVMVVLCGGFFLYQHLTNKNKSTSADSSSDVSTEMNKNVSGGYYYYKL
jgi:hypothetical protein